ncbi:CotY/CotZ family spore coat protein [Calidifontibacillus oryziterrae]|uniref:CotY/CotZ family spore coat protein n=1 Tax=Calidifontibacillus oryziterrae TaxID=1191699 RepID=UPI0002DAF5B3|nr:CotY/CotZ family spore coat protein [Calidifontibacillus oryziterrae]
MEKKMNICSAMEKLLMEQNYMSENEKEFQFIHMPPKPDTIPFMLFGDNGCGQAFTTFCITGEECIKTSFFRLEKLNLKGCCAVLSLLKAVDMDGCQVEDCDKIYSLIKTKCCVVVDLRCFCAISPLSPILVNRPLPIIEPKC